MDKVVSWEAQLHFRLSGNNKRYQLKIKGIKVYSSNKDNLTGSGSIKTKIYKWQLALALHYDIKLKITKICLHHENEGFSLFYLR